MPPKHCPSNEDEIAHIRKRHREAMSGGMSNAEASAYANDPIAGLCLPATLRASLGLLPTSAMGTDTAHPDPGQQPPSLDSSPPVTPQQELTTSIDLTGVYYPDPAVLEAPLAQDFSEPSEDEIARVHPDGAISQTLPAPSFAPLSESGPSPPSAADNAASREPISAPSRCSENKVGRDRLPNGTWPTGVSGNPKGRKPKNLSNDLDGPNEFEQTLDRKFKIPQGGKQRTVTPRKVLREQTINRAIKGDHPALRLLMAYCDKHGSDLFAGEHKAIRKGLAAAAAASAGCIILNDEVLDGLSSSTIDDIRKVMNVIEAKKKHPKKIH